MVSIAINENWIPYIAGCMMVLLNASTWQTNVQSELNDMRDRVIRALNIIVGYEPVMPPVQFRLDPSNALYMQYSIDGGINWLDMPHPTDYQYPEFIADSLYPSGYKMSVNAGHSSNPVPQMDQIIDNAVRTNPASSLQNEITSATGITPLQIFSGGTSTLLLQSQQKSIEIARKAGFDVTTAESFLEITKSVLDTGDVLITYLLS